MTKPIVVYLDSSDYSLLSDVRHREDESLRPVRNFLLNAVTSRTIEVRFSWVHVVEAFHRDLRSRDQAIARATLISQLSGTRVLRYFAEIVRSERAGFTDYRQMAYDDDGNWHPSFPGLGKEIQDSIQAGIQEAITTVPQNRKQRRIVQKLYGGDKGRKALLSDPQLVRSLAEKHGMSPSFIEKELFPMIVRSPNEHDKVARAIRHEVFNPVALVSHYLDRMDKQDKLRYSVLTLGEKLLTVRGSMSEAIERLRALPSFRDAVRSVRTRWQAESATRVNSILNTLHAAVRDGISEENRSNSGSRGLELLARAIDQWMWDVIQPKSPRNPLPSDAGDLLHMFYLPYVDLWRGDGYAAELARRVRAPNDAVPVASIYELEAAVQRLHAQTKK